MMPKYTWLTGTSADWTTGSDWDAGTYPDAPDAEAIITGDGAYAVSIAAGETIAVDAVTLDAAGATLSVAGVLALGGADALLSLQAGALKGGGVVQGGTIALGGGFLQMSGGTLDGVTVLGTLAPARFYAVNVMGGLTVLAADGSQPGSIDLTGGVLNVLDSETLDNVGITIGGPFGGLQEMTAGDTLTLGANASLEVAGGSLATVAGTTLDNLGLMVLDADLAGPPTGIAAAMVNDGSLLISGGAGNSWSFIGASFTNAGAVEIGAQGALIVSAGTGFANSGTIVIDAGATLELDQNVTLAALTGPGGGSIDNEGGTLVVTGTLDLGGGTLGVDAGGLFGVLTLSGTVANGTIAPGDGVLALPGATLDAIGVLGTLDIDNGASLYSVSVEGGLRAVGGQAGLLVNGGTLNLLDSETLDNFAIGLGYGDIGVKVVLPYSYGFNGAGIIGSGTLTFGAGAVLTTLGSAYIEATQFTNLGRIQVVGTDDLLISAPGFSNEGSISIAAGATLELDVDTTLAGLTGGGSIASAGGELVLGGTLSLTGATLDVAASGAFADLDLAGTVIGGTIDPDGGILTLGSPTTLAGHLLSAGLTLEGVTFLGALNLDAAANANNYPSSVAIADGLTLATAPGQAGSLEIGAGQLVILDNETLDHMAIGIGDAGVVPGIAGISDGGAGLRLTLGSQAVMTVAGSATISAGTIVNAGKIVLGGPLTFDALSSVTNSGTLTGSGTIATTSVALSNTGLIQAVAGGTLILGALANLPGTTLTSGSYEAQAGGTLDLSSAAMLVTDAATILLDGSNAAIQSFSATKNGYQSIEATLKTIAASGTLAVLGGRGYASTNTLAVAGLLRLGGGAMSAPGIGVSATGRILGFGSITGAIANAGSIEASGGLLQMGGVSGAGTLQIDATATLEIGASSEAVNFGLGGTLRLDAASGYTGTLTGFATGDTLVLTGTNASNATINGNTLSLSLAGGGTLQYNLANLAANGGASSFVNGAGDTVVSLSAPPIGQQNPCFLQGTRILTQRGEIAVEALAVGDLVPVLLGQGLARVRWIGQRLVQCRRHPKPDEVQPVRIEPGAFGPGLPHRALFLSPDHAVHVDGVLIPVRYLVNGSSIAQIETAEARYLAYRAGRAQRAAGRGLAGGILSGHRQSWRVWRRCPATASGFRAARVGRGGLRQAGDVWANPGSGAAAAAGTGSRAWPCADRRPRFAVAGRWPDAASESRRRALQLSSSRADAPGAAAVACRRAGPYKSRQQRLSAPGCCCRRAVAGWPCCAGPPAIGWVAAGRTGVAMDRWRCIAGLCGSGAPGRGASCAADILAPRESGCRGASRDGIFGERIVSKNGQFTMRCEAGFRGRGSLPRPDASSHAVCPRNSLTDITHPRLA